MQACLLRPGPPNLIMLLQAEQLPQSGCWQGWHTPHLRRFIATVSVLLANWSGKKLSNMLLTSWVLVALVQDGFFSFCALRISPLRQSSSCRRLVFRFLPFLTVLPLVKVMPAKSISARMHGVVINSGSSAVADSSKDTIWSQMNWAWWRSTSSVNLGRPFGVATVCKRKERQWVLVEWESW